MPNPLCPSTMLLTVSWGLAHSTRLQVSSALHLQAVAAGGSCFQVWCWKMQGFTSFTSLGPSVHMSLGTQTHSCFLPLIQRECVGNLISVLSLELLDFTRIVQLNIFSMWFTDNGETHRPLAAMLEIPLGHQLLSTIFLGLLPPAFLLPPFDFGFPIYIYLYFVPEHFIALW